MFVLDRDLSGAAEPDGPTHDARRGPFEQLVPGEGEDPHDHTMLQSDFFRESKMCGTCHDVSNPHLDVKDEMTGTFTASDVNKQAASFKPGALMPIERTFSEWKQSSYATTGVTSMPFGVPGNATLVKSCQDCHMRDVDVSGGATAKACRDGVDRSDMPIHDLSGGNAWVPAVLRDPIFKLSSLTKRI